MRYVLPILGLLLVIGGLAGVKGAQISGLIRQGKEAEKLGPPPESVSSYVAEVQSWEATLSAVGSIAAARGVAIANDAPGVVTRIAFDSGAVVQKGQVLVELDSKVERAQLASALARKDLAKLTAGRSVALVQKDAIPQAQADSDDAQLRSSATDVDALQAQIDRKTVRAPFAGRLGLRNVNLGQYLAPGTAVTQLEAIDTVYVDFTLPQQRLPEVRVGLPVRVAVGQAAGEQAGGPTLEGTITAVEPQVDPTTRTLRLRASVPNEHERLRPGMFATVSVVLPARSPRVVVPATSVVHASFGDSVFVVEKKEGKPLKVARQQFVRVGEARGDFVAIDDGLSAGQEVVMTGAFKLRNGSGVAVNGDVKVSPELEPHPQNR